MVALLPVGEASLEAACCDLDVAATGAKTKRGRRSAQTRTETRYRRVVAEAGCGRHTQGFGRGSKGTRAACGEKRWRRPTATATQQSEKQRPGRRWVGGWAERSRSRRRDGEAAARLELAAWWPWCLLEEEKERMLEVKAKVDAQKQKGKESVRRATAGREAWAGAVDP